MTKEQTQLEQNNTVAAVAQQPTEAPQAVATESAALSTNQVLSQAEIVELVATLGSLESELEMKREEGLEFSV